MIPIIQNECSDFLLESKGQYLIKYLPKKYMGLSKVKVRKGKKINKFGANFNTAFENEQWQIYNRAIFTKANANIQNYTNNLDTEPFYVFPINGYKYLYNTKIHDSEIEYNGLTLTDDIISDLLKVSYKTDDLINAFDSKCEVIFYNIPYYYALRASILDDYSTNFYMENINGE